MTRKKTINLLWLLLLIAGTVWILSRHQATPPYQKDNGMIFGTLYNVTYQSDKNMKEAIEAVLHRFDGSLSPFNDTAIITRVNRNEPVVTDSLFTNVFRRSMQISAETGGAFDITVAPLVNAWGFGFKENAFPDSTVVDSLLQFTGWHKVRLTAEGKIEKDDPRLMLTCSAVAKGYAVDVIAGLLRRKGVGNFMVDIGGEVVVSGRNPSQERWRIGINKPVSDSTQVNNEIELVLQIGEGKGIATSGDYRNFHVVDGKKYGHTINPKTGYPACQDILSATVVADRCAVADAYATAFMAMGREQAKKLKEQHLEIEYLFIYADSLGGYAKEFSPGMEKYMVRD